MPSITVSHAVTAERRSSPPRARACRDNDVAISATDNKVTHDFLWGFLLSVFY